MVPIKEKRLVKPSKVDVMGRKGIAVFGGPIRRPVSNPTKPTAKSFYVLLNRFQFVQLSGIM